MDSRSRKQPGRSGSGSESATVIAAARGQEREFVFAPRRVMSSQSVGFAFASNLEPAAVNPHYRQRGPHRRGERRLLVLQLLHLLISAIFQLAADTVKSIKEVLRNGILMSLDGFPEPIKMGNLT